MDGATRHSATSRRRGLGLGLGLAALVVLALGAGAGCSTLAAGRLLRDVLDPPPDLADELVASRRVLDTPEGAVTLHEWRPVDAAGPLPTFVLVHGAAAGGPADLRMVGLARALAARGAHVVAPELEALHRFRVDPRDPARLAAAAGSLAEQAPGGRLALLGISVGGTYALLACGDPRLAGRVSAVFALGPHDDLGALLEDMLTEPPEAPGLLDAATEGRRRVLRANVEGLVPPADVPRVAAALDALLDGHATGDDGAGLGAAARRVLELAASSRPAAEDDARELMAPLAGELAALSWPPGRPPPQAPLFVLHGESDPVVPPEASARLAAHLEASGGEVTRRVTGLFSHVDEERAPSLWRAWPVLRLLARFLDAAGL